MKRRQLLALVSTTGAAGCLRLATGDEDGTPSPTPVVTRETATPRTATASGEGAASVETASENTETRTAASEDTETTGYDSSDDYPTGLSGDGVSMLLLDTHVNELAQTSYTVSHQLFDVSESTLRTDQNLMVEGQRALYDLREEDFEQYIEITDGRYDPVVWRTTGTRTPLYGDLEKCCIGNATALAYAKRGHGGSLQYLYWALKGGDYVSPVPKEGGAFFQISADTIADPNPILDRFDADQVERFNADGEVSSSGIIRDLAVTVEYVRGDRLKQFEAEFLVTDIGATTVRAPDWVESARSRAPDLAVSVRDDRLGIEYVHEGGDAVINSTRVGIHGPEADQLIEGPETTALDQPLESGETLIVYIDGDAVTHARGSIPDGAEPVELPAEGWTNLEPPDTGATYFKKRLEDL